MSLNQYAGGIQKLRFENEFPHFYFGRLDLMSNEIFFLILMNKQTVFLIIFVFDINYKLKLFQFLQGKRLQY